MIVEAIAQGCVMCNYYVVIFHIVFTHFKYVHYILE